MQHLHPATELLIVKQTRADVINNWVSYMLTPQGDCFSWSWKTNPSHLRGATFTSLSVSSQMTACLGRASRTSTTASQLWSFVFSSRRTSWRWWKLPSPMSFAASTHLKFQLLLRARNNMEAKVNSQHRHWESCICLQFCLNCPVCDAIVVVFPAAIRVLQWLLTS